jgi:uncharacterized protein YqcC (DUF446 family)
MNPNTPSTNRNHQLADIINAIEAEMRVLDLWEGRVPSQADMSSRMPFCYDTLKFWQWLQWVLIPRIRLILAEDSAWPTSSEIAPLAETEFRRLPQDCSRLLAMIRAFDRLIAGP